MEILFCLFILLTFKRHRQGFSHIEFVGAKAVYFFSECRSMEVYINGEPTGLKTPSLLYFPANTQSIDVEYRYQGVTFLQQEVNLQHERNAVMGRITPVALRLPG